MDKKMFYRVTRPYLRNEETFYPQRCWEEPDLPPKTYKDGIFGCEAEIKKSVCFAKSIRGALLGVITCFEEDPIIDMVFNVYRTESLPDRDLSSSQVLDFGISEEVRFYGPVRAIYIGKVVALPSLWKAAYKLFNSCVVDGCDAYHILDIQTGRGLLPDLDDHYVYIPTGCQLTTHGDCPTKYNKCLTNLESAERPLYVRRQV